MNAAELAQRMAEDAPRIAEYLLPGGKKASGEWKAGSVNGESGQSLSVRITGSKRGVWKDFASGEGGDLLSLWAQCRSLSISQAMAEAKSFLGIRETIPQKEKQTYKRPAKPQCRAPKSRGKEWLLSRGITEQTIEDFKIGEQEQGGKVYVVFPYLRDDVLVNTKFRNPDDKKDMRQAGGAEPCLFGWHLIGPKSQSVAICEGEIDAMTLHQVGIPALSVNAGAGNHQWIDNDWERLERFSVIYLCYDDDEAGQKGVREVANRLGLERCRIVKFEKSKDANEYLTEQKASLEDFDHCLKASQTFDPEELLSFSAHWKEVKAAFWPAQGGPRDPVLRIGKQDQSWFEFRTGELTLWTGINGHGKSLMLNQVLIGLAEQGEKCCVFSGEMLPKQQGKRMAKQLTGLDRPSPQYLDAAGEWVEGKFWLFNLLGQASIDRLIEVFTYGFKRYGIRHFVIDSLMMTDVPDDGPGALTAQKVAMGKLANFCRRYLVHVHLVAHPRKSENESKAPGKMDVAGSAHLTNAIDNMFSVWSARKEDGEDLDTPDACLTLFKQRNADTQNRKLWLYFNRESQQYTLDSRRPAIQYVEFSGAPSV